MDIKLNDLIEVLIERLRAEGTVPEEDTKEEDIKA